MEPRSEEVLRKIFAALVEDATWEFRKKPLIELDERDPLGEIDDALIDTDEEHSRAVLNAKTPVSVKPMFKGYGSLTRYASIYTGIFESEIPIALKLIREYPQPDPEFDPNLEYWQYFEESVEGIEVEEKKTIEPIKKKKRRRSSATERIDSPSGHTLESYLARAERSGPKRSEESQGGDDSSPPA